MATVKKLQPFGNNIAVIFSDGDRVLAFPFTTEVYKVRSNPNGLLTLRVMGNLILCVFSSGDKVFAFPTGNDIWIVGPNDEPTPTWRWPFQYSVGVLTHPPYDDWAQFGPRDLDGDPGTPETFHNGLDFGAAAVQGDPIRAASSGTVSHVGSGGSAGHNVTIDHPGGFQTLYFHMVAGSITVSEGESVSVGQIIGTMGTTGSSTGVHLHFETHVGGTPVNPRSFMAARGYPET